MNAEAAIPLAIAVAPSGELHLDVHPAEIVPGAIARSFLADFELGPAHALLQLAARHPGEPLPPCLGFFRDAGALYLGAVCRQRSPAPPTGELERRAAAAPPMAGAEYLTAAVLEQLWLDLDRALETDLEGDDLAGWLEEAGVVVRVPDWWKKRSRVSVEVTLGDKPPAELGLEALVDFDVRLAMDGEPLSESEWRKLRESQGGLVLVRGRWVELDREK